MKKNRTQLIRRLFIISALVLPFSASANNNNVVTVGHSIDLSGPNSAIGQDYVAGIRTYFDLVNTSGGVNGKRVQYIVRDDQGKPELAVKEVAKLIQEEKINYLFGGVGDLETDAILGSSAFKASGLTLFAPITNDASAEKSNVIVWRPSYTQEVRHLLKHFSSLGYKEVGLAYQDSPLNNEAHKTFIAATTELKIKLTGSVKIGATNDSLPAEAAQLAASKPGFVVVIGDTISTALFVKEFRKLEEKMFIASTSLINLTTLRQLAGDKAVEWTVFSQVVPNPNAINHILQVEHGKGMKRFRDEPSTPLTLEGFSAAKAFVKALQTAKGKSSNSVFQEHIAQKNRIDIGGLSINFAAKQNLSSYLDIALFTRNKGLLY